MSYHRVITKRPNSPNINMLLSVVYFCYGSRTNKRQTYTSTINENVQTEKELLFSAVDDMTKWTK